MANKNGEEKRNATKNENRRTMSINMTQKFVFETDDLDSFKSMFDTILNILFWDKRGIVGKADCWRLYATTQRPTFYYPPIDTSEMGKKEKRIHICTIKDYIPSSRRGDYADRYKLRDDCTDFGKETNDESFAAITNHVIEEIEKISESSFKALRGEGFNLGFNRHDGHIGLGYRIEHSSSGGANNLGVYLVHAYYGK